MIERRIQSEVFLRHDIENILRAIDSASGDLVDHAAGDEVKVYRDGFRAALRSVATALHIQLEPTATWSVSRSSQVLLFDEER